MKKVILALLVAAIGLQAENVETSAPLEKEKGVLNKKGSIFAYWGYNRSFYTDSDIHFRGKGYSYTLRDTAASDRQSDFGWVYLTAGSIPQFNFKLGYFLTDRSSISIGTDHMKYVVDRPQTVIIDGTDHQGNVRNEEAQQLDGFIAFEHTDGLNYVNVAYEYNLPLWVSDSNQHALSLVVGPGVGVLFPKSNVTLYGYAERNDDFKIAGFGVDGHAALSFDFYKYFFVRGEAKVGFIDMPWIATTSSSSDSASQYFGFAEYTAMAGVRY